MVYSYHIILKKKLLLQNDFVLLVVYHRYFSRKSINLRNLSFFGFLKFLLLDRLPKALAHLFFVCQHIF